MENFFGISEKGKETFLLYTDPKQLALYSGNIIKIILILIITTLAVRFTNMLIDKFFANRDKFKMVGEDKRYSTLKGVIQSVARYTIYFIGITPILETL